MRIFLSLALFVSISLAAAENENYYTPGGSNDMCIKELQSAKISVLTHCPYEKEFLDAAKKAGIKIMPYVDLEKVVKSSGDPILLRNPFWRAVDVDSNGRPEWFCISSDGEIKRPFNSSSYHPGFEQSCNNHESLKNAQLKGGEEIMKLGCGGVFVDNAAPSWGCSGEKLGIHKHGKPEKTNKECYDDAARKFYDIIKAAGGDCFVNAGFEAGQKGKCDIAMMECYIYANYHTPENKDCMDRKYWRSSIAYWKNLKKDIAKLKILQKEIPRISLSYFPDPCSGDEAAFFSFVYSKLVGAKYWGGCFLQWYGDYANFLYRRDVARLLYRIHNNLGAPSSGLFYSTDYGYQAFENAVLVINPCDDKPVPVKVPVKGLKMPVAELLTGENLDVKDDCVEMTLPYQSARIIMSDNNVLENYLTEAATEAAVIHDYIEHEINLGNPEFLNRPVFARFDTIAKDYEAVIGGLKEKGSADSENINQLSNNAASLDVDKIMKSSSDVLTADAKNLKPQDIRALLTLRNDVPKMEIFRGGAGHDVIKFILRSARAAFVPFHYNENTFLNLGEDSYFNLTNGPVPIMGSSGEPIVSWMNRKTAAFKIRKRADMAVDDSYVVPVSIESLDKIAENKDGQTYRAICNLRGVTSRKDVDNYRLQMDLGIRKGQPFLDLDFALVDSNKNKVEDSSMSLVFNGVAGYIDPEHPQLSKEKTRTGWAYFVTNQNDKMGIVALGSPEMNISRNEITGKGQLKCSIAPLCAREYYFLAERIRNLKLYMGKSAALVNNVYLAGDDAGNLVINYPEQIRFKLENKSAARINNVKWTVNGAVIGCSKDNLTPLEIKTDEQKDRDQIICTFAIPKNFVRNDIAYFMAEAEIKLADGKKFTIAKFFSSRVTEPLQIGTFNIFSPSGNTGEKASIDISSVPACKGKATLKFDSGKIKVVPEEIAFSIPGKSQKTIVFDIDAPDDMMNKCIDGILKIETDVVAKKEIPVTAKFSPRLEGFKENGEIKIDGNLDKDVWKRTGFAAGDFLSCSTGQKAAAQTMAGIFYTENALYIGIKCFSSDMSKLTETAVPDSDGYSNAALKDDSIEIYIRPTPETEGHYIRLGGNSRGVKKIDQFIDVTLLNAGIYSRESKSWKMVTKKYADHWDAEIEIPFAVIGYKPEKGSVWGINFCRNQPKGDIASSWSFTDGAYNKPNYTGWLLFK